MDEAPGQSLASEVVRGDRATAETAGVPCGTQMWENGKAGVWTGRWQEGQSGLWPRVVTGPIPQLGLEGTAALAASTAATGPGPAPEATGEAPAPASASRDPSPFSHLVRQVSPEGLAAGLSTSAGNITTLQHRPQGTPLPHATPAPCGRPRSPAGRQHRETAGSWVPGR